MRTPRLLVLGLAAAVVWVAPVLDVADQGQAPEAVMGSMVVDDWSGSSSTSRVINSLWTTSAPMPAAGAVMVAADWGGDERVTVEVRSRSRATWGPWFPFNVETEHGPDDRSSEDRRAFGEAVSDPIWVGPADLVQFRSTRPLDRLDVSTIAMEGGSGLDWTPDDRLRGAADAATSRPAILPRASWNADESFKNGEPHVSQDARFAIIHHVGGGNWPPGDIEAGCAYADDWIRGIYAYHTNTRNYDDIAYNFIVDPCGNVWEGRSGGVELAVQGAHASGFNSGSVGVLALGTYSGENSDPVTPELVDGIERLLAWKFDVHHVDPDGTTTEVAGGGGSSRYQDGDTVDLPVISAHQIQNSTTCPGDVLMQTLFDGSLASASPKDGFVEQVRAKGLPKAFGGPSQDWEPGDNQDGNDNDEPLDEERPVWDVSFTEPVDWRLEINDEDGDVVRATGGAAERTVERVWDLRDANGEPVRAGSYTATLTAVDDSTRPITPIVTQMDVSSSIGRVAGDTRVTTAVKLSQEAFEKADEVVLASSQAYPDALVASPLAASLEAPVLLTPKETLDESVAAEIERLGATTVRVIGGAVAVSSDVTDALATQGLDVIRIAGRTRFDTAARVATVVQEREGTGEVLIALGSHPVPSSAFPDALAAGAFGALVGSPVLLVEPGELPADTRTALAALAPDEVQLFGGTVAIDAPVERAVERAAGVITSSRFAGEDRFDTAALAATEILTRRPGSVPEPTTPGNASRASDDPSGDPTDDPSGDPTDHPSDDPTDDPSETDDDPRRARPVVMASGRNWPDALGAGAATAALGGVFVLLDDEDLDESAATAAFLEDNADIVSRLLVAGGPVAIASRVVIALEDLDLGGDIDTGDPIFWPRDPAEPQEEPEPVASESPSGGVVPFPSSSPSPSASPSSTSSPSASPSSSPSSPSPSPSSSPSPTTTATPSDDPDPSPSPTSS